MDLNIRNIAIKTTAYSSISDIYYVAVKMWENMYSISFHVYYFHKKLYTNM